MDKAKKAKLLELRQKKNASSKQTEEQRHSELLDAVHGLHSLFGEQNKQNTQNTEALLVELSKSNDLKEEVAKVKQAIKELPRVDEVSITNLSELIESQKDLDLSEVVKAVNELSEKVEKQQLDEVKIINQEVEDFIPMRRVRKNKLGKLEYDDEPLQVSVVGGGGSITPRIKAVDGNSAVPVANPDGTFIGGGSGGGGDASAEKQDEQTALLTQIEENTANISIDADSVNLNTDEIEAKLDTIASQQQQDALTDAELRASPINSNLYIDGAPNSGANPAHVTGQFTAVGAELDVELALNDTNYDLDAAAYDETTSIGTNYEVDHLEASFTTEEEKTISVYTPSGVLIDTKTTTSQNVIMPLLKLRFQENENIRVTVTQTDGACLMSLRLYISQGSLNLGGNPIVNLRGDGGEFGINTNTNVAVTKDGELMTATSEKELNVMAGLVVTSVNTTSYYGLVDLSDTTNYHHDLTARIDVSQLHLDADRGTFQGFIRFGVITDINGTEADITFWHNFRIDSSSGGVYQIAENYAPSQIRLGVSGGATNEIVTNSKETTTSVDTGTPLAGPAGNFTPAIGDVIVKFERNAGTLTEGSICLFYHGEDTV